MANKVSNNKIAPTKGVQRKFRAEHIQIYKTFKLKISGLNGGKFKL